MRNSINRFFILPAAAIVLSAAWAFTLKQPVPMSTETATLNQSEASAPEATTWALDASHSNLKFTVTHLMVSEVEGKFKLFDGKMTSTAADFSDAQIEFSADVSSINTDSDMRDNHLRSDDFFNVEKYPAMTFKSTSFKKTGNNTYKLTGNLSIRDVTQSVTFDVVYGGEMKDPYGNIKAGFKATGSIDRLSYGLKWNAITEAGGTVVSKDVKITANVQLLKK